MHKLLVLFFDMFFACSAARSSHVRLPQVLAEMVGDPQRLPHVQQTHLSPAARRPASAWAASESPGGLSAGTVDPKPSSTFTVSNQLTPVGSEQPAWLSVRLTLSWNKLSWMKTLSQRKGYWGEFLGFALFFFLYSKCLKAAPRLRLDCGDRL